MFALRSNSKAYEGSICPPLLPTSCRRAPLGRPSRQAVLTPRNLRGAAAAVSPLASLPRPRPPGSSVVALHSSDRGSRQLGNGGPWPLSLHQREGLPFWSKANVPRCPTLLPGLPGGPQPPHNTCNYPKPR